MKLKFSLSLASINDDLLPGDYVEYSKWFIVEYEDQGTNLLLDGTDNTW